MYIYDNRYVCIARALLEKRNKEQLEAAAKKAASEVLLLLFFITPEPRVE